MFIYECVLVVELNEHLSELRMVNKQNRIIHPDIRFNKRT